MNTEEFLKRLETIVAEYIADEEAYSDDVQLQINTLNWDMEIADSENDLPDCDYWPMMDLIRISPETPGKWEPDQDAISQVGAEYVFTA